MDPQPRTRPTLLLAETCEGHLPSARELYQLVHAMLRSITGAYLRGARGHTLQPKALVQEAWERMIAPDRLPRHAPRARLEFFAMSARAMRQVLVGHARQHQNRAQLRHGRRVEFDEAVMSANDHAALLAVDAELDRISGVDVAQSEVLELRLFAGLSHDDIASLLELPRGTIDRAWHTGAARLARSRRVSDDGDDAETGQA